MNPLTKRKLHKLFEMNPEYSFYMPCPKCREQIWFSNDGKIKANIESDGEIKFNEDFYRTYGCENPECEWSKCSGEK